MLIKNVYVVDPYSNEEGVKDIRIENEKILEVKDYLDAKESGSEDVTGAKEINSEDLAGIGKSDSKDVIDGSGLVLLPGLLDVHVHFRDPGFTHKEDMFTGAMAAARGGFTRVVLMANTNPTVDNVETLKYVLEKGSKTGIKVLTCASVTKGLKGEELVDFDTLYKEGAVGFTDDGIPLMDENILKEAFVKARKLNVPISLHEEDKRLIHENGINAGKASAYYGITGSPREAEYTLVKRDTDLAIETGATLDIQHISAKESVEIVRQARKKNANIFAEVTPHHIALTEDAVIEYGSNAKMNPPLRTAEDRKAIIEGIKDSTIGIIATDHAPHSIEEKSGEITKAPSGIIGLETAFSVAYDNLVKAGHISLMELARMFTVNPSKLYGFEPSPIKEGYDADFALVDLNSDWTFDKSVSKSCNSPFLGKTFSASVVKTICKGKVIYEKV